MRAARLTGSVRGVKAGFHSSRSNFSRRHVKSICNLGKNIIDRGRGCTWEGRVKSRCNPNPAGYPARRAPLPRTRQRGHGPFRERPVRLMASSRSSCLTLPYFPSCSTACTTSRDFGSASHIDQRQRNLAAQQIRARCFAQNLARSEIKQVVNQLKRRTETKTVVAQRHLLLLARAASIAQSHHWH